MSDTDEKVMCVGKVFVDEILGRNRTDEEKLQSLLIHKTYRNRHAQNGNCPDVEHDDRYKQLIPYIVVVNKDGQILAYNRGSKGGEKRLASKWAIGFGGHVNDGDADWMAGVVREIEEELNLGDRWLTQNYPLHGPIGFINDDSDDVGRHHLGVVYILRADEVVPRENPEWCWSSATAIEDTHRSLGHLENWARLALPMVREWMEAN